MAWTPPWTCTTTGIAASSIWRLIKRAAFWSALSRLGCPECPNGCIKSIHPNGGDDLDPRASGIHQEITGTLGPNIGGGRPGHGAARQQYVQPVGVGPHVARVHALICDGTRRAGHLARFRCGTRRALWRRRWRAAADRTDRVPAGAGRPIGRGDAAGGGADWRRRAALRDAGQGPGVVPFEPRSQTNLALGYAVAPTGPR